jgi:superfamily II DNA or RNA helicase
MSSKHSQAVQLIGRGLYDDLQSFAQLEQRISALGDENSTIVGDAFEIFVEGYLATHQKLQADTIWLVKRVPLEIRQKLNLPNDAKGIDGVFRTRTGTLVPYQAKFRSRRANLTFADVATFLGLTERATDRIIITNAKEVAKDAKNRDAMRTVRGLDFDELTTDELRAISARLRQQPIPIPKATPYPHQVRALSEIAETLTRSDRTHVVMACGTGKTLVALWAVEQLKPKTVLVLVPSLTLLQQTLDEWSRHNSWGKDFTYLCVCSDPTVTSKDEYDPVQLEAMDLEFRVDTDPDEVRRFIEMGTSNIKVVFSTYHSSSIVSDGVRALAPFDVAIFDEAHKTTGPRGGSFAHALFQENIDIRKRLFFTATPRHYDIEHKNRQGDFKIQSMDDPAVYGPRAYTLTFGSAARQGIICNYRVVISVVDGQEVNDFTLKYGITLVEGDLIGAKWVANQIAIERAVEKTDANHIITFHSRVSSAEKFSSASSRGIKQFLPDFWVFHVNGSQHSSERKQIIRDFREAERSLITNARCLTEGIDVPAVDMVGFIDPRHSKIDIAQATGRAMRKPRGSDKMLGYIVVPLFLERKGDETPEQALEQSDFSDVSDVLNALQEQDEDLIAIVRELQEAKGRGEVFNPRRLAEKVDVLGPTIDLTQLRSNIFAEIVDRIGVSWDVWFGRLKAYKDRESHCRVPARYIEDGYNLGTWVGNQRSYKNELSGERRRRLDDLGFVWDAREADWEEGFSYLKRYKDRVGNCRVPTSCKEDGYSLGTWVGYQRSHRTELSSERQRRLEELGLVWDVREADWEEGFNYLKRFRKRIGDCRVPARHKEDGYKLGSWVATQRSGEANISSARRRRLDELGFEWDPFVADWEKGFRHLRDYEKRVGDCRVPTSHREDGYSLGRWIIAQRKNRDQLSTERQRSLDELGFVWDPLEDDWEEGFSYLKRYRERVGNCRVPLRYKEDGYNLGPWVARQRKNEDKISSERRRRLDELGFVWDALGDDWEEGFSYLKRYKDRVGDCRVPLRYKEDGFGLGKWVGYQRFHKKDLSEERRRRLDDLGFEWDPLETDWEEGFRFLTGYKERVGDCRVPRHHQEGNYKLGSWVGTQRGRKNELSSDHRQRLDDLGFVWDPLAVC